MKILGAEQKIYLKKNYEYHIFIRHGVLEAHIDCLFDMKKLIRLYPSIVSPEERIDAEINVEKGKRLKVVFQLDPVVKGKKFQGKIGIITAFYL